MSADIGSDAAFLYVGAASSGLRAALQAPISQPMLMNKDVAGFLWLTTTLSLKFLLIALVLIGSRFHTAGIHPLEMSSKAPSGAVCSDLAASDSSTAF